MFPNKKDISLIHLTASFFESGPMPTPTIFRIQGITLVPNGDTLAFFTVCNLLFGTLILDLHKAELPQVGFFFALNNLPWEFLSTKKLEIKKLRPPKEWIL